MSRDEWLITGFIIAAFALILFGAWAVIETNKTTTPTTGFEMETVKTGDVTWACLKHQGEYLGCDTVETMR